MKNANTKTAQIVIKDLVKMGTSDAIGFTETTNSITLRTNKLKVQIGIEFGLDQDQTLALDSFLPVIVAKTFDVDSQVQRIRLPVAQLLALASNGLFELFNTNPKDSKQFDDLVTALTNGYCYPSSYAQSLKRDPFSWATFIGELNADRDSGALTPEQLAQYTAVQAKAPKIKELSAFLMKAYDSPKWQWLAERMDAAGYTVGVVSDDLENLL